MRRLPIFLFAVALVSIVYAGVETRDRCDIGQVASDSGYAALAVAAVAAGAAVIIGIALIWKRRPGGVLALVGGLLFSAAVFGVYVFWTALALGEGC